MKLKSKMMTGMAIIMMGTMLCACSDEEVTEPADTVIDMHDNIGEAQAALDAYKGVADDADAFGDEVMDGTTVKTPLAESVKGYEFDYRQMKMSVDMDYAPFRAVLGTPENYYEVPSCAFNGKDKIYPYGSIDIYTYPDGDIDRIAYIDFRDDTVSTPEGACLYMTKDEILNIYGTNYTEKMGAYCYAKDGMELRFIFDGDSCVSIKYSTLVLDAE